MKRTWIIVLLSAALLGVPVAALACENDCPADKSFSSGPTCSGPTPCGTETNPYTHETEYACYYAGSTDTYSCFNCQWHASCCFHYLSCSACEWFTVTKQWYNKIGCSTGYVYGTDYSISKYDNNTGDICC
jgi:hypothetical protein